MAALLLAVALPAQLFDPGANKTYSGAGQSTVASVQMSNTADPSRKPSLVASYDFLHSTAPYAAPVEIAHSPLFFPGAMLQIGLELPINNSSELEKVGNGNYDAKIRELARYYKALPANILLRIGYECDGSWNGYEATRYIAAFRRIVDLFEAESAFNVAYVWNVSSPSTGYTAWYPGNAYVDWWSYNFWNSANPASFISAAAAAGKPVLVGESSKQGGSFSSGWWSSYFASIRNYDVRGFQYINWWWDTTGAWTWGDSRYTNNSTWVSTYNSEMANARYVHRGSSYYNPAALFVQFGRASVGTGSNGAAWSKSLDEWNAQSGYDYSVQGAVYADLGGWSPAVLLGGSGGTEVVAQAENLTVAASSGDTHTTFNDGTISGTSLAANAIGDFVTYTVNVPTAGTYTVKVGYKKWNSRGQMQLAIDGTNQGSIYDEYDANIVYEEVSFGNATLAAGNRAFRFTVTGKNAASTGFGLVFDYIKLTPVGGSASEMRVILTVPGGSSGNLWLHASDEAKDVFIGSRQVLDDSSGSGVFRYDSGDIVGGTVTVRVVPALGSASPRIYSAGVLGVSGSAPAQASTPSASSASSSGIALTWPSVSGASHYVVLREGRILGYTTATNFNDTTIAAGKPYRYSVGAFSTTQGLGRVGNAASLSGLGAGEILGQTESLVVAASSGDSHTSITDAAFSNNLGTVYSANAVGDFVTYTLNVPTAGSYTVKLHFKTFSSRGQVQLAIDGTNLGSPFDAYSAAPGYQQVSFGTTTLAAGNRQFRLTVTGKNAASSGYIIVPDYIVLTPSGAPTPTEILAQTESLSVAASSGDAHSSFNDGTITGTSYSSNAAGDFVTYTVPVNIPGTYDVRVRFKKWTSRGQFQLAIDGTNQGSVYDEYDPNIVYEEVSFGTRNFTTAGDKQFRFTVTGKNAASSGFGMVFDHIRLVP